MWKPVPVESVRGIPQNENDVVTACIDKQLVEITALNTEIIWRLKNKCKVKAIIGR
jgi:hypothetical protein